MIIEDSTRKAMLCPFGGGNPILPVRFNLVRGSDPYFS